MNITLDAIKKRDQKRQIGYITVEIDGNNYEFSVGNIPIELTTNSKILAHLESRKDEIALLILKKLYPESDYLRLQKKGMTEIQGMQEWIKAGNKNLIAKKSGKNIYKVIEKKELEYKHPKSVTLVAKIESANITPELKDLLKEIVK